MIITVLVLWFAAVAIAGIVISPYDFESAVTMILGIVAAATLVLLLGRTNFLAGEPDLTGEDALEWPGEKFSCGK